MRWRQRLQIRLRLWFSWRHRRLVQARELQTVYQEMHEGGEYGE